MFRELIDTIADAWKHGDLAGHLATWWSVVTGAVDPKDRAGWPIEGVPDAE